MHRQITNIALISDNSQRIKQFSELLRGSENKVISHSFEDALKRVLVDERQNLVVMDCPSNPDFDYRELTALRNQQSLKYVPFIFILTHDQETLKKQIYHNPQNKILTEPLDKFTFISVIGNALYTSQLERRLLVYKDLVEGEKKLITNIDKLMEFDRLGQLADENQVIDFIRGDFCHRLEMTLAVETVLYGSFQEKSNEILISAGEGKKTVTNKKISVSDSLTKDQIGRNFPYIFEDETLSDPFVKQMEEMMGFKIVGLLFVPITIFHEVKGVIILINKLYRNEFTENDLAFALISIQKIIDQLEKMQIGKGNDNLLRQSDTMSPPKSGKVQLEMYHHIMESVHFGAILFDADYHISYMNRAALELLHLTGDAATNLNLQHIINSYEFEQLRQKIDGGEIPLVRQEMHIVDSASGEDAYLGYSLYPFSPEERKNEYILVFSEISQTKRIQAEIIRMDRMASLGILSAGIAHEIRNPLAGIKAMAQTLQEELDNESGHNEYVERILRQVNRLDDLLKAFFSYTNPHRPEPKPVHIQKIIQNVMPLFERRLRYDDITVMQSFEKDIHEVFVDENQIEQVFLNLFLNAFDAIGKSGRIEVTAINAREPQPVLDRRNRLTSPLSNRYIKISIKDNGIGMPEGLREKIFDPFFTTKSNGTGLGLSIVYQIIREHGGQIDVTSKENGGTEFIILLPAYVKGRKTMRASVH